MSKLFKLNLQHFSEGAPEGGEGTGEGTVDAAQEETKVVYGKQDVRHDDEGEEDTKPRQEPSKPTFEELIEGDYKEDFSKKMQSIVQGRIQNIKGSEENLKALEPILSHMADKYGVDDVTDIPALVEAFENDDSLYEEEAEERGVEVSTLKEIKRLERQNAEFARQMEQREKDVENAKAWEGILQQSEQVKDIYPNFDIEKEMQNDDFAHLVAVNVPVKTAFEVIHHDELQALSAKAIADQTARKVADSVKANKKRTGEGQGNGTPVVVKKDPKSWTDEERDDVYDRVMNGEKIYL